MFTRTYLLGVAAFTGLFLTTTAWSQQAVSNNAMLNTVQISASVTDAISQDKATIRLFIERRNTDPNLLANEVNRILEKAANEAKKESRVKTSSGTFRTWPVTTDEISTIMAWQTRAELILESQNFSAVSELAGKLMMMGMEIANIQFSLSEETRFTAEKKLTQAAVTAFRERAEMTTKLFGFKQYDIVDIILDTNSPMPYRMASTDMMMASPAARRPDIPMMPGEATVTVTISGKIRMR